jgi:fructose-bisphosphate aldolase class II
MLVNLNDVLLPARRGRYAVGLFNAVNLELARGVFAAAERNRSPVIVGTAEVLLPFGPLEELAWLLVPMARRASVPVVVHFDHGLTEERCLEALKLGFSSIMYDCSTDGYEENIRKTKEMASIAHAAGASIEAELGHVGDAEGSLEGVSESETASALYTDPEEARDFVERTGVDALAIAVGTAHGHYRAKPKLDFDRIARIAAVVPVPLVLHGGSGLSDDDFRTTIARGISKVNVFTDINAAAALAAERTLASGKNALTDLVRPEVDAVEAAVAEKMRLFGSTGKA